MIKRKYRNFKYVPVPLKDLRDVIRTGLQNHGDKPAFLVKDKPGQPFRGIPFQQFSDDIDALGTVFCAMGLRGKKIAIIGENSYPWVVAYFAVSNGTGVVVPLDRDLMPREVANLAGIAEISAIVYDSKHKAAADAVVEALPGLEAAVETDLPDDGDGRLSFEGLLAKGRKLLADGDRTFLDASIDTSALCTILFTSGTTGLAKGVMLSQANLIANIYHMSEYVRIEPGTIGLSVLPMHHTYEMTCHIMAGLYQGATVTVCEGLKHIAKNLAEVHANLMLSVPLIFETMHKKIWAGAEAKGSAAKMRKMIRISRALKLYNHPWLVRRIFKPIHETTGGAVNLLISGGAGINPKVIEDFVAMGLPMIQGYGMTENAPIIAVNRDRYSKAASVGVPLPGTEVRIHLPDESGVGEIICRGPSVMMGYYNNPEETAKTLRDGWLYTGDYGYFDGEGYLYIAGRKKNVIIAKNGKNIYPEEIEHYLEETGFIAEALVHGAEAKNAEDIIIKAQIYPDFEAIREARGDLGPEELRAFIGEQVDKVNDLLPLYKRIKRFAIRMEEFEKTTTRKIKRHSAANYVEEE
jgi:long-chain acyl-CoA synthetase